jgi:hypothetical protein
VQNLDQEQLEAIKARAAEPAKWADVPYSDEYGTALQESQADVLPLVAEVERLRKALAGTLFDGESITAREAIRTELINMGIRAYVSLDGVKDLVEDLKYHESREGGPVNILARINKWVDVRDVLQEVLYAAGDETPPVPKDTPPASQ